MSLFGDIMGFIDSGRAAGAIGDANIAAEHGILQSTKDAQDAMNRAQEQGQAGVSGAIGNAYTDVGNATGWANETLADTYNRQKVNFDPYSDAGKTGVAGLQNYANGPDSKFKFNMDDYFNSDAYKFQLKQGQDSIQNTASAAGLGNSGAALKQLTQYGQGLASTYYNQAFNQAQSTFQTNQNATLANMQSLINAGEFGAAGTSAAAGHAGDQIAGNMMDSSKFLSGLNVQGNEFNSTTGITAQEIAGKEGMLGSKEAGDYAVNAGIARAGGILGQGNAITGGIGDLASLAMLFF